MEMGDGTGQREKVKEGERRSGTEKKRGKGKEKGIGEKEKGERVWNGRRGSEKGKE